MIFGMNSRMTFGKYKDELVSTVLRKDPQYLDWAYDNIEWFELDPETENELDEALDMHMAGNQFHWED
jgi:hypothetical protein